MLPAYHVSTYDLMEVVHSIAVLGPQAEVDDIVEFTTGVKERPVKEAIKIGCEIGLITDGDSYSVPDSYADKIREVGFEDRDVILERALLGYRPFRNYLAYLDQGYGSLSAAKKVNVVYDIASKDSIVKDNIERLGEYAGLVDYTGEFPEVNAEPSQLPTDSVESVDDLRKALQSQANTVLYLEEALGETLVTSLDDGIEEDLLKAFNEHAEDQRNSFSAAGRALEDYLKQTAREHGSEGRDFNGAGVTDMAGRVKGDGLIAEVHNKRCAAIGTMRNKSGGHGKDHQTHERWEVPPETALSAAIETTLLIKSIHEYVVNDRQIL